MRPVPSNQRQIRKAQKGFRQDYTELMHNLGDQISGILKRHSPTGKVQPYSFKTVRSSIRKTVYGAFVVPGTEDAFASDGVTGLTPYATMLNTWYVTAVAEVVYSHQRWMKANIPEDVYDWLANANSRPAVVAEQENDGVKRLFAHPLEVIDPSRTWVPIHRWTSPDGYQLSDRIWRVGNEVRGKIDVLLARDLQDGRASIKIGRDLAQFLLPQEAGRITKKPYGKYVSYSGMRLARTELTRAANQAAFISSYVNPYVEGIDVSRSTNGDPTCSVCPDHTSIDLYGQRVREPYAFDEAPIPPEVTHPHCMCHMRPGVVSDSRGVTSELRQMMQNPEAVPMRTAAQADSFLMEMLGAALFDMVKGMMVGK